MISRLRPGWSGSRRDDQSAFPWMAGNNDEISSFCEYIGLKRADGAVELVEIGTGVICWSFSWWLSWLGVAVLERWRKFAMVRGRLRNGKSTCAGSATVAVRCVVWLELKRGLVVMGEDVAKAMRSDSYEIVATTKSM